MFITDECEAEKNALRTVWQESVQFLCTCRVGGNGYGIQIMELPMNRLFVL